jgi:hypothetical protein
MVQPKIKPEGDEVALRPLLHGQHASPLGVNPAREMEAGRDQRIVQSPVHEVL